MKKKRKENKRFNVEPKTALRSRYEELLDIASYYNKLNPKEKEWMDKFASEYVSADIKRSGKNPLHKGKAARKICFDKNNSRNRDIYNKSKAAGKLDYVDDLSNKEKNKLSVNPEDAIIECIDKKERFDDHDE